MRHNPTRDMLVGATAMAALAGLVAFSYAGHQISSNANVGTYPVTATFNRVDGLFEGDEVRLSGIRIGTVGEQQLDNNYRAVVTLNIDSAMNLPTDSAVAIHTDGLFGSKFVVFEAGVDDTNLKAGDRVQYTQGAVVVSELLNLIIEEGKARKKSVAASAAEPDQDDDTPNQQEGN